MFANNSYAKVWKVYPKKEKDQKFTLIQLSTSRKDSRDNSYTTDFSGYARLCGEAEKKAASLEASDSIKLLKVGVTNFYNKEKDYTTTTYLIFDFEFGEKKQKEIKENDSDDWVNADIPEDALPFN